MTGLQHIDETLIDSLLEAARASPRLRKNHNFHDRLDHPCQRLLNALLPDACIPPHRHLDPNKEELLLIVRGALGLVFFDDTGTVTQTVLLETGGPTLACNIPAGVFHTAVAFGEGAVVFEAKAGPYAPHRPEELAKFAPAEGDPRAADYRDSLKALFAPTGGADKKINKNN